MQIFRSFIFISALFLSSHLVSYSYNTQPLVTHGYIEEFAKASQKQIISEPQLDSVSCTYALKQGGPLTQLFLQKLHHLLTEEEFQALRINIKSPRLSKGYAPESGNWHCDFHFEVNPLNPIEMHRPNEQLDEKARHFVLISSGPCTEFITKEMHLDEWSGEDWEEMQDLINSKIDVKDTDFIPPATIVEFRGNAIHRATTYKQQGETVRYFIRASLFPKEHSHYMKGFREQTRDRFSYKQ